MAMKNIRWKRGAAALAACVMGLSSMDAGAAQQRVIPLTAGVLFLLAQDMLDLPAGGGEEASVRTAELSVDLLRLCSENSFGEKEPEDVRELAQRALDGMSSAERAAFMNNFEERIVPFCDGLFAGDEECLSALEDPGDLSWAEEAAAESGDQGRWEILKEAVLSLQ